MSKLDTVVINGETFIDADCLIDKMVDVCLNEVYWHSADYSTLMQDESETDKINAFKNLLDTEGMPKDMMAKFANAYVKRRFERFLK